MKVQPLILLQRDLYQVSLKDRFTTYMDTMLQPNRQDIRLPLQNMNPMAKEHVPHLLTKYVEMDADSIAAKVLADLLATACMDDEVGTPYADVFSRHHSLTLGLVLVDDAAGGWTDRLDLEFKNMFATDAMLQRGWVETILWSSSADPTEDSVRRATEAAIHRTVYRLEKCAETLTLKDMLNQESWVWKRMKSHFNDDHFDLDQGAAEKSVEILREHQDASILDSYPLLVAAYFGDDAAAARGYPRIGMNICSGKDVCKAGLWDNSI